MNSCSSSPSVTETGLGHSKTGRAASQGLSGRTVVWGSGLVVGCSPDKCRILVWTSELCKKSVFGKESQTSLSSDNSACCHLGLGVAGGRQRQRKARCGGVKEGGL